MKKFIVSLVFALTMFSHTGWGQLNKYYYIWRSEDLMMENRYKETIDILNLFLRVDPDAYEAYFLRGIAKYNLDDLLGAEYDFTLTLQKNPVYTTAYQYRAITRTLLGNYDDALKDFDEAINLRPDRPGPYYSRGVTYLMTQQFRKAIDDFDMFLRRENKMAEAYLNRGTAYLHLKDTVAAYENYDQAIRTNREYPRSYVQRGSLLMDEKKYADALKDFDKAIELDPVYWLPYFNRARVYYAQNRPMLALADLDTALRIDSTNSITYFNRAIIRSGIGDYNRAMDDYDKVAEYSPSNVIVYYNRAGLNYQLGELDKALRDYDKAIELYPDFANAYLNRASVKYLLKDDKGAESDRKTAEMKIAEYRSKLSDVNFSIYADTSRKFNQLLSFDSNLSGSAFRKIVSQEENITLRPLYKFTLYRSDPGAITSLDRYPMPRLDQFVASLGDGLIAFSNKPSNISPDSLLLLDGNITRLMSYHNAPMEQLMFKKGITQSLIKQYTNAVNTYSAVIELEPTNPFHYLNRSTTRAEMIDFISSIDNSYNQISLDSDPSRRLRGSQSRTYNYDEAIADLNKAAKLYPEMAYIYYNRGNLLALSGELPEAFEDYSRAIELKPDLADAWYNRGLVQIFMKDTRKGLLDVSKAGELGIAEAYTVLKRYSDYKE